MASLRELRADQLYTRSDPEALDFETTAELAAPESPEGWALGQPRAVAAIELGVGVDGDGYNIFALGPPEVGKHHLVRRFLEEKAAAEPPPPDRCYVHDFDEVHRPRLLTLPAGRGGELRRDMEELIEEIGSALAAAFESEDYQTRRQSLEEEFQERQAELFEEIRSAAKERGLAALRTPQGVVFAPLREEEVISPEEFGKLPEEERKRVETEITAMQQVLQRQLRQLPRWQREARQRVRELNREVTRFAVDPHLEDLRRKYAELPGVVAYLDAVENDVVENARELLAGTERGSETEGAAAAGQLRSLSRYAVNLLVDHSKSESAPIVHEDNPTFQNLIGRIEHLPRQGALVTDFTLIKPGALHRASGGYLILEAERLLTQPFAWQALKRALFSKQVKIESPGQALSLISTVSLEPEPMPLDVKVVVTGERLIYYLLAARDPDFGHLFKVAADFEERLDRNPATETSYARLIAALAEREGVRPLDRGAVARVIEHGARSLGDSEKLTTAVALLCDVVKEADYWAGREGREVIAREDVQQALDARVFRSDRLRARIQEEILRETILIDTAGERTGQINGLAVLQLGGFAFGRPSRITARVRLGKGQVVDIEREVKLSGPLHSKGVLILASFLGARYAADRPLSLAASLVFEQSYGGIDGDSASSAELYALLSAIARVPIRQSLAVTGSVNQHGEVQAIGGVNEKIEGFFDICSARGLTGDQGVLIPAANVKHLMLRQDVVDAVGAGRFHVWPVAHVDQGIELLTGVAAGERGDDGQYPEGTINHEVERRLAEMAERSREFATAAGEGGEVASEEEPEPAPEPPPEPPGEPPPGEPSPGGGAP